VTALLQGRLRSAPFRPLLLLEHGRAQREIPAELWSLAAELQQRRGAPVLLRALTDLQPADLPTLEHPLGLVPLLLLPGEQVRHDHSRLRRGIKFPFQGGSCDRTAARLTAASSQGSMQAGRAQLGPVWGG
jgi:hypothetical protein